MDHFATFRLIAHDYEAFTACLLLGQHYQTFLIGNFFIKHLVNVQTIDQVRIHGIQLVVTSAIPHNANSK